MGSQYAQIPDFFRFGLPQTARGQLTDDQIVGALGTASATMDSKFRGRYVLPLIAWGDEVTKYCCWLAAYELMAGPRGFNPAAGADSNLLDRYDRAIAWLDDVQRMAAHPDVTPSSAQDQYQQPTIITSSVTTQGGRTSRNRGW